MVIDSVEIANFRSFKTFSLKLDGDSVFLVSENAAGKTSLLLAITKALGRDRTATLADFADSEKPIEIVLTLSSFDRVDQASFPKELSFTGTVPSLRIGFRAEWNASEEEANSLCGFPDHDWKTATREQRDALRIVWLPAYRDPVRLLQLAATRGFWSKLFASMYIDPAIATAVSEVDSALRKFAARRTLHAF